MAVPRATGSGSGESAEMPAPPVRGALLPRGIERAERTVLERRWLLFVAVLAIYLLTATYGVTSIDILAADVPAWSLATSGQLELVSNPYPDLPWFFEHNGSVYSDRFPGAIVFIAPAYWVAAQLGFDEFSRVPGAITAAVVTACAVLVMNEVYGLTLASRRAVHVATLFTAFGTGAWSVCAHAPWSHSLDFLLLALGLWALAKDRIFWAGLTFGGVVLTRPQWAIALAVLGISLSLFQRSVLPAVKVALGMLPGVALLFAYNGTLFGRWGPSNGQELGGSVSAEWTALPLNILGGLLSPTRGLVFYYPIVLVGFIMLPRVFPAASAWQKAATIGGTCGIIVQLLLNRYSGGGTFFGPRLWIEPLVLWAPLLAVTAQKYSVDHPRSKVVPLMLLFGVVLHGAGAILLPF